MKHIHFDIETDGFYGAYWECPEKTDAAIVTIAKREERNFFI